MEKLKPFEEFGKPDPRITAFHILDKKLGGYRPSMAKDLHDTVSSIVLHTSVPEEVRSHFAVAANLYAYSWFYYPFIAEAGFLALITVEKALRDKLGCQKNRVNFYDLIIMATKKGFLCEAGYSIPEPAPEIPAEIERIIEYKPQRRKFNFIQRLPKLLTTMRNSVAHGETSIHPWGAKIMQIAAETINQLYEEAKD